MKNNKLVRELVPVNALLLYIIVILILCVVSARGKRASEETETASETVAESTVPEQEETGEQAGSEENDGTVPDKEPVEVQETIELEAEEPAETPSPAGQGTVSGSGLPPAAQVSGNNGVTVVKKTNSQMLAEMMDYWSGNNVEAVEDLSGLAHYRAMSASLKSSAYFYYYGDRNEEGRPEGTGIAVYGEDQYYYGEWKDGFRSGQGMWIKMYYGDGKAADVDPAFVSHSYEGAWLNNLPNGEGHERYDLDVGKAEPGSRYFQNIIGNFKDGLYDGDMYINTLNTEKNVQEWKGKAKNGVFETFEGRDLEGRVPICQDVQNPDSHMWIQPLENKDQGIEEVRDQIKK